MQTQKAKKLEFPDVPVAFAGRFPKGHINSLKGWNFPVADVLDAAKEGRMLTIDLDMGGKVSCSLACGHCFNSVLELREKRGELLGDREIREILREAKTLGLRSVKIIGPGEPMEQKALFGFLEFLVRDLEVLPMLFTRATTMGSERHARSVFGLSSEEVGRRLFDLGVSLCITVNSFDRDTHISVVKRRWYPEVMLHAIELAAGLGFNRFVPGEPTRLGIAMNPITRDNVDEIFEAYAWARPRHIHTIMSPLMVAGLSQDLAGCRKRMPEDEMLFGQYVKINLWAIERGLTSLEELERKGIASYAGGCQCQQLGLGLFVRRDGVVLRCPGDDASVQGNVKEKGLAGIWHGSENYRVFRGSINVQCPPKQKGGTFPEGFFERVLEEVERRLSNPGKQEQRGCKT